MVSLYTRTVKLRQVIAATMAAVFAVQFTVAAAQSSQTSTDEDDAKAKAWALLSHVAKASEKLSYSGTFVYSKDGNLETMTIDHGQKNGVPVQRLASLGDRPREIIKDVDNVSCVLPDKNMGVREARRDLSML